MKGKCNFEADFWHYLSSFPRSNIISYFSEVLKALVIIAKNFEECTKKFERAKSAFNLGLSQINPLLQKGKRQRVG